MEVRTSIAGITHAVRENPDLARAQPNGPCTLRLDVDNKYAKHPRGAFEVSWNGNKLGYLSDKERDMQDEVVRALDAGENIEIAVVDYAYRDEQGFNDDHRGQLHAVTVSIKTEGSEFGTTGGVPPLASFNEPGVSVNFNPGPHIYTHEGRQLTSVTTLRDRMYEPFDKMTASDRCAKPWGMKAEAIREMWDLNGEATAAFGTAVHLCIENFEKHGERALPKMPFLREIVATFPRDEAVSVVHSEALLTNVALGVCGLADRIEVSPNGLHTVADIKVQHGINATNKGGKNKLYPELPKTKLAKALCQTSIYSELLEASGIKVTDTIKVLVWDGTWTMYEEKRIRGVLEKVTKEVIL